MNGVIAVEHSSNKKIGKASATYVTQHSCPECVFKHNECYAEFSYVGMVTRRLNSEGATNLEELAQAEATAIDNLSGRLPLRVHVVGDCITDVAARHVGAAMARHTAKAGYAAWTYTHGWRDVQRKSWGDVAVQASCETIEDVRSAHARGYGTAVVVDKFRDTKRYNHDGIDIIPCLEQTGRAESCVSCGLCLRPNLIEARRQRGISIGFAAHGATTKVRNALAR